MSTHPDKVLVTISVIDGSGMNRPIRQGSEKLPLDRNPEGEIALMESIIANSLELLTGKLRSRKK